MTNIFAWCNLVNDILKFQDGVLPNLIDIEAEKYDCSANGVSSKRFLNQL